MYFSDNSTCQSKSATAPLPFSTQTSTSSFDQSAPSSFSNQKAGTLLPYQLKPKVPWSTGLCKCFSDVRLCCLTLWCPCITFGRIAEVVDKGGSSCCGSGALYVLLSCVTGCPCLYSCFYRSKMRRQYALQEKPCCDCLLHCCCECCALCQEYRELKNRGLNMTIGWHGNVERQQRELVMAPVVEPGMSK